MCVSVCLCPLMHVSIVCICKLMHRAMFYATGCGWKGRQECAYVDAHDGDHVMALTFKVVQAYLFMTYITHYVVTHGLYVICYRSLETVHLCVAQCTDAVDSVMKSLC